MCEEQKSLMLQDTLAALEDVKAGRVVDGKEVMDWLATWGTEAEKNPHK